MKSKFDEDYYERGIETCKSLYSNYRWIPELTIPLCVAIIDLLTISSDDVVLDFGCGKGYMVKAMRLLHRRAYGVDISEYAISQTPREISQYVALIEEGQEIPLMYSENYEYDWIIAKDVLEHISYSNIKKVLTTLRKAGRQLFIIVPIGRNGHYVVPAYELDETHIIRESLDWWVKKIEDAGFTVGHSTYRVPHIKENWSQYEQGNGFIFAH